MNLSSISTIIFNAAELPETNQNGMKISLPGVLSHASRSLKEMASPFEDAPEHIIEQSENRLMESQPLMHAHSLEELGRHLEMLKKAIATGDVFSVRQFFDLYKFD